MRRTTELPHGGAAASAGRRRWPWALAAVGAGALAGAAVAWTARRVEGVDGPDAVEPDQVQAVVDRPDDDDAPA